MPAVETGLLDEASVDLGKHLSMHPALRANRVAGGQPCSLSLNGEFRFTGRDCLLMSIMRVTTCKLSLQPARSNAFDVHNSLVGNPIPDQGGFNTVPMCNCNFWLDEGVFAFPSNHVINQHDECKSTR